LKAVLFDLYDTLAYIAIDEYRETKDEMAKRAGLPGDTFLETWKQYTRPSARGEVLTVEERVARVLRDLHIEPDIALVQEIAKLEYRLQWEHVKLFDSAKDTIAFLKGAGLKVGMVTNTPNSTRDVLSILGIADFFDTVVFSFAIGVLKPDPRIYLVACENLAVMPAECMFVGDGNDRELDGAHALGMITVMVGQKRDELLRAEQSRYCDYKINDLSELKGIVTSSFKEKA
jgi:putative hydrolase of the HAD superfamily